MPDQSPIRRPRIINSPKIAWSFRQSNLPILLLSVAVILVLCLLIGITIVIVYFATFSEASSNRNSSSNSPVIAENISKPENNTFATIQILISEPTDNPVPAWGASYKTLKLTTHPTSYSCSGAFPPHLELNKDAFFSTKMSSIFPQKRDRQV